MIPFKWQAIFFGPVPAMRLEVLGARLDECRKTGKIIYDYDYFH